MLGWVINNRLKQAVAEVVPSSCFSLDLALVRGGFKQKNLMHLRFSLDAAKLQLGCSFYEA